MSFLTIAFQTGAFQEEVAAGEIQEWPARAGISVSNRARWYIIDGQKLYLDEKELAIVVAAKLNDISRKEVKELRKNRAKPISNSKWTKIKETIGLANTIDVADNEEDEEALLMLM